MDDLDGLGGSGQEKWCSGQRGIEIDARRPFICHDPIKAAGKKSFLRRKPSASDARVVEMSLTDKSYKQFGAVAARQKALDEFVFGEFGVRELIEFAKRLPALRHRLETPA
ncbi:MarR family winged helix-turn-helix transcriptional regulator [Bradyrhizobium sp. AZCC 2289]|uniref:MarR family winged helix-turn-helix transcriptional regulator n=1 Tax=Bradyrhizobium sp. AZCC 2289 TaxID=3117026 RepID=UPI002FF27F36